MPTQDEYSVSIQRTRELYAKINVLNFNFQLVDEISGYVVGVPSFTNTEGSNFRRTANITLIANKSTFDETRGNYIWIDKYIQIYIGIKDVKSDEIVYTNMGIYLVDNPNKVYSLTDNSFSFQCVDLMAQFTGDRNGVISGMGDTLISAGTNVKEAFMSLFNYAQEDMGITMKIPMIQECNFDVPNDITVSAGATYYELFTEFININPLYQIYFDVDGVFHYELIPTISNNDIIVADDHLWNRTEISRNIATDLSGVKNVIEVYGHTWQPSIAGGIATHISDPEAEKNLSAKIDLSALYTGLTEEQIIQSLENSSIGVTMPELDESTPYIRYITIYVGEGILTNVLSGITVKTQYNIPKNLESNQYYILKVSFEQGRKANITYMSGLQAYSIVEDTKQDSPFNVNSGIGRVRLVLSDENYENLFSDYQCSEVARKELYLRTQMYDSITLTTVPIYWLDVNNLVKYQDNIYLVKSISTSDTQLISLMRVYE